MRSTRMSLVPRPGSEYIECDLLATLLGRWTRIAESVERKVKLERREFIMWALHISSSALYLSAKAQICGTGDIPASVLLLGTSRAQGMDMSLYVIGSCDYVKIYDDHIVTHQGRRSFEEIATFIAGELSQSAEVYKKLR